MKHPPSARLALLILFMGAIMISYSGIFVKLSEIGPQATGFYRMFLPLPALALWLAATKRQKREPSSPMSKKMWLTVGGAGFFLALDLIFWHWALKRIPVGAATLLGNTAPFWVALTGYIFFKERFTQRFILGMCVAFLGAVALIGGGAKELGGGDWLGYGMALLAGAGYGGYLRGISQARSLLDNNQVMFYSAIAACLTLLPVMLITEDRYWPVTLSGWAVLLGLAYMAQFLGQGLIAWAMGHLPASFGAVSLLINPVAAALFAWVTLGETLSLLQIIGGGAVLSGIMLAKPKG